MKKGSTVESPEASVERVPVSKYARIFRPGLLLRPLTSGDITRLKRPKRKWIILAVTLLIITAATTVFLIRSRSLRQEQRQAAQQAEQQEAQLFTSQSKPIIASLAAEIDNIHQNNFLQIKKVTKNYDEAKTVLAQRMSDLESSQAKIAKYENDYRQLRPNAQNKELADKADKLFALANTITAKYKASLTLRDKTLQAYNEPLSELAKYSESASKGEELPVLIAQTDKIVSSAQAASDSMSKLAVGPDDKPLHDLRTEYLADIKTTFTKLNGYYREYQPDLITAELEQFNNRNVQRNEAVATINEDYVASSSIAQDFAAFKQSAASL